MSIHQTYGKGSRQRRLSKKQQDKFDENFERIFGKKENKTNTHESTTKNGAKN
jgi:hypothetical protein